MLFQDIIQQFRSSTVFLRKDVLKICSKFTGEHPCRSAILVKFLCSFIEITLWNGCSPVNLLHIFRTPFPKNTSQRLLLNRFKSEYSMHNQWRIIKETDLKKLAKPWPIFLRFCFRYLCENKLISSSFPDSNSFPGRSEADLGLLQHPRWSSLW